MRIVVATLVVAACGGSDSPPGQCSEGETRECYQGPDVTLGVGTCRAGIEACANGRFTGICIGDITPFVEHCDGRDEDCDGAVDDVSDAGTACTASDGCDGELACAGSTGGDDVECIAPVRNPCDVCGGPFVPNVGNACFDDICEGVLACNANGDDTTCTAPAANACGICGGPAVIGVGDACASGDGCAGENECNPDGTAAICNAPAKNACAVCGGPEVAVGAICSGARGCTGVTACNSAGDAAVCQLDSPCGHLVISEVSTRSAVCSTDEYIELYNPTARAIPLDGYTLRSQAVSSGNFTRLITFATTTIPAHGYLLVASSRGSTGCSPGGYTGVLANTVAADRTYAALDVGATAGQIWLTTIDQDPTSPTDAIVVDLVGYGPGISSFEGAGAASPASGGSIERKANAAASAASMATGGSDHAAGNAQDSDNNAADFVTQAVREPQSLTTGAEP